MAVLIVALFCGTGLGTPFRRPPARLGRFLKHPDQAQSVDEGNGVQTSDNRQETIDDLELAGTERARQVCRLVATHPVDQGTNLVD